MVYSFRDKEAQRLFNREHSKKLPQPIQRRAYAKLIQIHRAIEIRDVQSIPGNRFEYLKGEREGHCSIRINNQWRVCFFWEEGDVYEVEIVDYH